MSLSRFIMSLVVVGAALGGCAKPPSGQIDVTSETARPTSAIDRSAITGSIRAASLPMSKPPAPERIFSNGGLAGRTLAVASNTDLILRPGEVVLTFDDGPRPGRTDAILATLDQFGVKATFMMLGNAAEANPDLAKKVATAGHTIGSHSYDHANLTSMTRQEALDDIAKGERAVTRALVGSGSTMAPFFRFPYLSQDGFLRTSLTQGNMVVLDVDIDSKDYYKDTPEQVAARTMQRLQARGSGIILFHDIHPRTVAMLPSFLKSLEDAGYSVVRLTPRNTGIFGRDLITADAPLDLRGSL